MVAVMVMGWNVFHSDACLQFPCVMWSSLWPTIEILVRVAIIGPSALSPSLLYCEDCATNNALVGGGDYAVSNGQWTHSSNAEADATLGRAG